MSKAELVVPVQVTPAVFRRFAFFDSFRHRQQWRRPVLFAFILSAFAVPCFAMVGRREHAALLGGVLLAVGLGLPAVYVACYAYSVQRQAKALGRKPQTAYVLHLGQQGLQADAGQQWAQYAWDTLQGAYRVQDCIYLYVSRQKAFLLPSCDHSEAAWALLQAKLSPECCRDLRRGRG